ncbi:MAG: LysR family transcriptional regulator [Bdellovibrionales bacterium]
MNLQQLNTFCTVLQEGSMTAAAQKLFLTQPAVSQQIRQLEDDLGVELLVRGSRKTKSTAQGSLLYDFASRIIHLAKQAELSIQSMGAEVSGPIRVGTLNSLGLHLISPVFSIFLQNNNQVSLKLNYGSGIKMIDALENGEVDVAILPDAKREYGGMPGEKVAELIGRDEMWLVASTTTTSGQEIPSEVYMRDLGMFPLILLTNEYPNFNNQLSKGMKKAGVQMRPVFESSNVGSLKRIIESGLGWGFLPAHSIKKQITSGRMKRIKVKDFDYSMDLICYYPNHHRNYKTTEVFVEILRQQSSSLLVPPSQ